MKLDLKLYRGYVNEQELVVFGHLFKSLAPDRYRMDRRGLRHAVSVFQMFRIKPLKNIQIRLKFKNKEVVTKTLDDGYFRFNLPFNEKLDSGWHTYEVSAEFSGYGIVETGEILKPYESKLAIITDIDDTFLISHSNNFFKKLYVLLLRNINKRKIFDDVVEHYQYLSLAGQDEAQASNSFFYVSSSEWNLYGFIHEFAVMHQLPKAVIKLKKIKTGISDFLLTGRGSHDHKFEKVKDIISFYPNLKYVLLGDDSQKDPDIYERICKIFPENIRAVYIRQTTSRKKNKVVEVLKNLESLHVSTCYFKDSERAISHSKALGIN
ncbi:App1 family protein [Salegentibacter flavus]|uniref:Phosphatidate phosphatase APP1 n=1 Tax=Salegentibacter flavus TaxID=287099 RepID=A0A1I4YN52_9FLAO|nr:App1 family protein [Salegentibacter flavus]SFN39407.1 Phosphatidate phosphatase APP1 [Salegentibacter flavus]